MIKHKQLYYHKPEIGEYGDCQRTVLACLLNVEPESIPNFGEYYGNDELFFKKVKEYLDMRGYTLIKIPFSGSLQEVLNFGNLYFENCYYMLSGKSKNGTCHVVICKNDYIYWDTSKDNSGIIDSFNGYYWIEFLVDNKIHL